MIGKCPHCGKLVGSLNGETVDIHAGGRAWKGATFACPSCNAVLGAGIDPVGLKDAIVDEVSQQIQKHLQGG
jgi:hypothetical protein